MFFWTFSDDNTKVLLSDTVGFLRNLPTDLIASFRSTLGEIRDANLLLKVIDITSTDIKGHMKTIDDTLEILNCHKKKSLIIFNKIDKVNDENIYANIKAKYSNCIFVSSLKKLNINILINSILKFTNENLELFSLKIDYKNAAIIDFIYNLTTVMSRTDQYDKIELEFKCSKETFNKIKKKIN